MTYGKRADTKTPSSPWPRVTRSICSRDRTPMAIPQTQAHERRSPASRRRRTSRRSPRPPPGAPARPKSKTGGRNNKNRKTARHRVAATSSATASSTSSARTASRVRRRGRSTTRTATAASCCCTATTAKRYILAPDKVAVGDVLPGSHGSEIPATPCPCATSRSAPPCHNVELKPGGGGKMARSAGSSVQLGWPGRLRHPAAAQHRDAPRAHRLPRHRRRGRQQRGRAGQDRQGRPQPLEGRPPPDPWCGHEPVDHPLGGGEEARPRWSPPGVAVGQTRGPHPRHEQGIPEADRPPPAHVEALGGSHPCHAA